MSEQEATLIDLTGDGGVLKKILQEGTSDDHPSPGCKVSLHYTGTLENGTKFDSSLDRNEPFEFELGKGSVIKAFDIGISSMKKGEKAVLTCAPQYAYGESGSPPNIGPNATLIFEIELLNWKQEDLTTAGDGGILRYPIKRPTSRKTPNDGANVKVHIVGKYEGKVFDDREISFDIGDGEDKEVNVISGIETALTHFGKGETSRLVIAPKYAFGNKGHEGFGIPPDATVEYTVTLHDFEREPEAWKMDAAESLNQAKILKEKATKCLTDGRYARAIQIFDKANSYLSNCTKSGEEEAIKLKAAVFSNMALCHLKLENYLETRKACDTVLELDSKHVKAYYRRGQAYVGMREPALAAKDFRKVIALDPENKAAKNQLALCEHEIKTQEMREKQLYSKMFKKISEPTEDEDKGKKEELSCGEWNNEFIEQNGGGDGADAKAQADQVLDDVNRNVVMIE